MKTPIIYTASFFLVLFLACFQAQAQDPMNMSLSDVRRVMFDSDDPSNSMYQPYSGLKFPWPKGQTLYFAWHGSDLWVGTNQEEVSSSALGNPDAQIGPNTYTVSAAKPSSGSVPSNTVNLFFDYITVNDGSETDGYGLLQFTTLTQTALDNPNSLVIQDHHVQVANWSLFSVTYQDVSATCNEVDFQFVVNW